MSWLHILLASSAVAVSSGMELCCESDPETESTYCGDIPLTCEETKYRSYDGSCNNLRHRWWGTPQTPYRRLLCNSNIGGADAIHDKNLPNPRTVSLRSFVDLDVSDPLWTLLFMQYGQIIAHDLSLTSGVAQTKKDAVACCTADGKFKPDAKSNPRCAPIPIPEDDPYNAPEGVTCMDFFRVETTKDGKNCTNATDIPEPLSAITSYLDVSYLYGSDNIRAKKVREFKGGRLAGVKRKGKVFLPQDPDPELTCNVDSNTEPCYFTGDVRVNQNPQLALLHNLYLLHHNTIAGKLSTVNPHWNDEILFQETRRVVIAIHQWIIYHEFLPGLLGEEFTIKNKLYYPNATDYINDYNSSVNPSVSNEFAACAFRTFHTEIVGIIRSIAENRNTSDTINLYDWFDKPSICEQGDNYNGLMIGLASQPQGAIDRFMPKDILNLLFKMGLLGLDLKAIDIQRGRDQGVCSCAIALKAFNISDVKSFKDFEKIMSSEKVAILKGLYKSPEDVDLCTCAFLEDRVPQTVAGPLVRQIVAEQFYRARVGDRYYFENGNFKHSFTLEQVNEIRQGTLAEILCYNKDIKKIQPEAFKLVSEKNSLKFCTQIRKFNPMPWRENKLDKPNINGL